ncbi:MAG: acyl carrier protein [Bacteroidales bacterium]
MNNLEKYNTVFINNFHITEQQLPKMAYQSVSAWDSIGHMGLITALEEAFDIMIDTDDIIDFSSYEKGKQILKKYNVAI